MTKFLYQISIFFVLMNGMMSSASSSASKRIEQFSNQSIHVWKTIIYPSANNKLTMHRHECDRVLVALTNGLLKITSNKGKSRYLKLKKGHSYYLTKDIPNELHTDENLSNHVIKVIVVELKNQPVS